MKNTLSHHQYSAIIKTPIGGLGILTEKNNLIRIDFLCNDFQPKITKDLFCKQVIEQLRDYFSGKQNNFDLMMETTGTPFQHRVWQALQKIPFGKTLSYGELASKLNTSARAIGNACRANPIPVIIPCHRIVGANSMGGFAGARKGELCDMKQWLLQHEKIIY